VNRSQNLKADNQYITSTHQTTSARSQSQLSQIWLPAWTAAKPHQPILCVTVPVTEAGASHNVLGLA